MKKIQSEDISPIILSHTRSFTFRELKVLAGRIATIYQAQMDGAEEFFITLRLGNLENFVESNLQN